MGLSRTQSTESAVTLLAMLLAKLSADSLSRLCTPANGGGVGSCVAQWMATATAAGGATVRDGV